MTRAETFNKNKKRTHDHRSAMSNSAGCDSDKHCSVLKLQDMCHNPKCSRQKQITFTPKQFQHEGGSIKSKLQKAFKGTQTAWNKFLEPGLKMATPLITATIAVKTKNLNRFN